MPPHMTHTSRKGLFMSYMWGYISVPSGRQAKFRCADKRNAYSEQPRSGLKKEVSWKPQTPAQAGESIEQKLYNIDIVFFAK